MHKEKMEPLEDWIQRMQKLLNQDKPYTKEERGKMECNYYESAYYEPGTELIIQFIMKWYPQLHNAGPDFAPYIKTISETVFTTLLHRLWENVKYNRDHKSPCDIPNLEFDELVDLLKMMRHSEPSLLTEQDMTDPEYSGFNEENKRELMKEINEDSIKSWKYIDGYTRDFIGCMQRLFFGMWPELMDMESEWWPLYEYDMLEQSHVVKDRADIISSVHRKGLDAKWLDEDSLTIMNKLTEREKPV
ncbi:MAG: hypothetical protein ABI855_20485 [Bacteroidota bacterium]